MAVKPGCKQTEVGVIAEEWQVVTATEACSLVVDCKNRTPPFVTERANLLTKIGGSTVGHAKVDDIRFLQRPTLLPAGKGVGVR